jgi:hypothetical protein
MRLENLALSALLLSSAPAHADVSISSKPTQNMDCQAGVCTATAQKAVLNVGDLQTMLGSGDVAVKTGTLAKDIEIAQPLTWSSTSRLTLDAQRSVTAKKQVTVTGQGALTVTTNDTGTPKKNAGEFIIVPEHGSIQFWDLSSSLTIDGNAYTLVGDIKTLAADIATNPSGFYALAKPYDASGDGTYTTAPINIEFDGTFHGLGNKILNLAINVAQGANRCGLFAIIGKRGTVADTHLTNIAFQGIGLGVGGLVNHNEGLIIRSSAAGEFSTTTGQGGLVAENLGSILYSFAKVRLEIVNAGLVIAGGLAGYNGGAIRSSYSQSSVVVRRSGFPTIGGLVGENAGKITKSYSVGTIVDGRQEQSGSFGGLVGMNDAEGTISTSYAAGTFKIKPDQGGTVQGGLIGTDSATPGAISSSYWDLDKGISDPSQGAGNIENDPGITGLTTAQFQSGLPAGFDPMDWNQKPNVNNGFPYLRAAPPK